LHALAYFMNRGLRAENSGPFIAVEAGVGGVREAIWEAYKTPKPVPEELSQAVLNKAQEKYDWVLPDPLLHRNYASAFLDARAFESS
jgi:ATP-dependent helicase Lhr and Lhr-like helicase